MSNITRAERLANALSWFGPTCDDADAELRRLAESERALLEALELAASIIGHHDDDTSKQLADLIAKTKDDRK